jgi:hypothetical protein
MMTRDYQVMKGHRRNLIACYQVKAIILKRIYTLLSQLDYILEKVNLCRQSKDQWLERLGFKKDE